MSSPWIKLQVNSHLISDVNLYVGAARWLSYSYEISPNLQLGGHWITGCLYRSHTKWQGQFITIASVWTYAWKFSIQLEFELRILSFLLKDRVYPGDLWEIVAERTIEAKQEAILQQHQSIRVGGFKRRRHVILEHLLMEEKKKRGQMEVSLYSQVIDHLQHHQMCELLNFGARIDSLSWLLLLRSSR